MAKKKFFVVIWLMTLVLLAILAETEAKSRLIIEKDTDDWQIVVSAKASPSEKHAASELHKYLKEISGAELPIVTDDNPRFKHEIILGDNTHLRRLGVKIDFEKLGPEGFTIRMVGRHLVIAGGRVRGTMYGVYAFLQDHLGCRWFTPEVSHIPKLDRIVVEAIDNTQVPALEYRSVTPRFNSLWYARNKLNGHGFLRKKYGGGIDFRGQHTFLKLVPPEKYFKDHPEYYSEINGKRISGNTQLCLSNPEVLKIAIESLKKWIREEPKVDVHFVSQMDYGNWCQCDTCAAIDKREESPMGSIMTFVNKVAEAIEPEFPEKYIGTFAYNYAGGGQPWFYSRKPPKTLRPRRNVIVMMAVLAACTSHPVSECSNGASLREDIEGWSKILGPETGRLYIHGYSANLTAYLLPVPNLKAMKSTIKYYVNHGVKGMYDKGDLPTPESELRSYLFARLYWNPDSDVDRLIDEFLESYYGRAASFISEYMDLLHNKVQQDNIHLDCHSELTKWQIGETSVPLPNAYPVNTFLTPAIVKKCEEIFEKAEKAVADDKESLLHVQTARLGIRYFQIGTTAADDPRRIELINQFFDVTERAKIYYVAEQTVMDKYKEKVKATLSPGQLKKWKEPVIELEPEPSLSGDWKLQFSDNFERAVLGKNWCIMEGEAGIKDGRLVPSKAGRVVSMMCTKKFPGSQRLEFDLETSKDGSSEITCILGSSEEMHWKGGANVGNNQSFTWITVLAEAVKYTRPGIASGSVHHVACQKDGNRIMYVRDGKIILTHDLEDLLEGKDHQNIGFYIYSSGTIDNVKVYTK